MAKGILTIYSQSDYQEIASYLDYLENTNCKVVTNLKKHDLTKLIADCKVIVMFISSRLIPTKRYEEAIYWSNFYNKPIIPFYLEDVEIGDLANKQLVDERKIDLQELSSVEIVEILDDIIEQYRPKSWRVSSRFVIYAAIIITCGLGLIIILNHFTNQNLENLENSVETTNTLTMDVLQTTIPDNITQISDQVGIVYVVSDNQKEVLGNCVIVEQQVISNYSLIEDVVLDSNKKIYVSFPLIEDSLGYQVELKKIDLVNDLVAYGINYDLTTKLNVAITDSVTADKIYSIAYHQQDDLMYQYGEVLTKDYYSANQKFDLVSIDLPALATGSPIVNDQGELLGIVANQKEKELRVIPLSVINNFLN